MAIALLGVAGPAVVFRAAIPLLAENFGVGCMAMLFGFLVIAVGLGALIRHMQKITSHAIQTSDRALLVAVPPQPQYIDSKSAVMTSVTENTTRSFDLPGEAEPE